MFFLFIYILFRVLLSIFTLYEQSRTVVTIKSSQIELATKTTEKNRIIIYVYL